jgi:uncharacterized repeat protein (TIGR01451 family)
LRGQNQTKEQKMKNYLKRIATGAAGLIFLATTQSAFALGTASGTTIANQATVGYTVGGVAQTPATSNTVNFVVDRKILLTVAEVGGAATTSVPGSTVQVTTFTVTNSSNAMLDFRLTAAQDASATALPFGGTDNFNGTNLLVFVDSNANGVYDSGVDTATFLDEIPADTTRTVFVLLDVPAGQVNGDKAGVVLTATAAQSGVATTLGTDSAQNPGAADNPAVVDTVFADVAGTTDAVKDGKHSARDQYNVSTATITVNKTAVVISDPFNGVTNPKAIPGATVEYCIQVSNTGGAPATSVNFSDGIPANTTYVASSIFAGGTVTGGVCNADGTAEDDNNAGADETDPNGGSFGIITPNTVAASVPSVAAGATTTARFRVTIN